MRLNVRSLALSLALAREGTMGAHARVNAHGARAYGARRPPPPANVSRESACWEAATDARTGKTYWWNVETDETTDVDAARPKTYSVVDPTMPAPMASDRAPPPARYERGGVGGIAGGFGSMMAQGAAWGMGSSMGHRAIGGLFGGSSWGGGSSASGGGGAENAAPPANPFESGELDDDAMDDGYGDGGGSLFDFFSEDE